MERTCVSNIGCTLCRFRVFGSKQVFARREKFNSGGSLESKNAQNAQTGSGPWLQTTEHTTWKESTLHNDIMAHIYIYIFTYILYWLFTCEERKDAEIIHKNGENLMQNDHVNCKQSSVSFLPQIGDAVPVCFSNAKCLFNPCGLVHLYLSAGRSISFNQFQHVQ